MSTTPELLAALFEPGAPPCFAVLDGARDERVHTATQNFTRHDYLIDGVDDPALIRYAPRLVDLGPGPSQALRFLLDHGFGHSWGYFVHAKAGFRELRDHLAGLLDARLPDGRELRFRLFDPRVLRAYLPTCTPAELDAAFGPISAFWLEAATPEPDQLVELRRGPAGELETHVHPLTTAPPLLTRS